MGSTMTDPTFDFIIVGGGTSGCLLAHRLSHAASKPSVLLVEAGGHPEGDTLRAPYYRYTNGATRPDLDHGYTTVPQKHLNNREIAYARGKGLGGTTMLNFMVYLYGSSEDYNHWSHLVSDPSFAWPSVQRAFKRIENYDFSSGAAYREFADPREGDHGKEGRVDVCLPRRLEKGTEEILGAMREVGEGVRRDFNGGDPVGVGVFPGSYSGDGRTTSATAHLVDAPGNLEIWTDASVRRLVFEGKKVMGVETLDGRKATSTKDVIICAGAFDSPKLLLLNGIGPADELKKQGIEVVQDLPGVGKNLQDHMLAFMCVEVDPALTDRWAFDNNAPMILEAQALWKKDRTGDLAHLNGTLWGGFLKLPDLESWPEYQALDKDTQEFLSKPAVPTYELCGNLMPFPPGVKIPQGSSYLSICSFLMNPMSRGAVTLASADPREKPLIDMAYLSHPYDRRQLREATRASWNLIFGNPHLKKYMRSTLWGPKSLSDEDIDVFLREAAGTVWHANGSVRMGRKGDGMSCVGSDFRVFGVEGLRVADCSVAPLTPNNHTQTTAYLIGEICAEKIIEEYQL